VGIDIGSKAEIYDRIHTLASKGIGVIFISDEVGEIAANCNRVFVMHEGEVLREFREDDMKAKDFKATLAGLIANPDSVSVESGSAPAEKVGE
jgi:simple sugar transport system ATP-binding protein